MAARKEAVIGSIKIRFTKDFRMGLKDKLDKIEQQAEEKKRKLQAASKDHHQKADELKQRFDRVAGEVIRPALTEGRDYLLSKNHGAILQDVPNALILTFCREKVLELLEIKSSNTMNYIAFTCNMDAVKLEMECSKIILDGRPTQQFKKAFSPNITREQVDEVIEAAVRAVML